MRSLLVLGLLMLPSVAQAAAITFEGTIQPGCTITLDTPGSLSLNATRTAMTSELSAGGVSAIVAVVSTSNSTLTIGSPTLEAQGSGYSVGTQTLEVAYTGLIGLTPVIKSFSTTGGTYPILSVLPSLLTMDNRIVNSAGFPPGTYRTQTLVTCGP